MRDLWVLVLVCLALSFLFGWLIRSLLANRKLERLRTAMDQTQAEVTSREAELLTLGGKVSDMETSLKDAVEDRDRLRVSVLEQAREIQAVRRESVEATGRQDQSLRARHGEIEAQAAILRERDAEVVRLKGALEEMARMADSNGERERDLDELRRRVAARDEEIARLNRFVQALEPLSSQLSEAERALTTAVEAKNAEITRLTNQVAKLESALSESSGPVAPVPAAVHLPAERASDPARLQAQLSALMDLAQIEFRADTAELAPASRAALDRYLEVLRANTELPVEISGHTDNSGEFWHSYELSRWRARAVKEYLVGKGAVADRLLCHGCGMTRPVADNTTATGRRANNRIEFRVCMEMIAARAIARGEGRGEGIMAAGA